MAAVGCVLSEDQLLCSICLEVFIDPVTTPCGHSFCKTCINKHWDNSPHCHCPVCKENFSSRPQLKLNTFMCEMVAQFKNKPHDEDLYSSEPHLAEEEVLCDVCSEPKLKALKSCLVCLLSYCQNHLQPHITVPRLKKHQLIQAQNMEHRICSTHDRPLELFCRDDQQFICLQCICEEHRGHNTVPLKEECEVRQAEMKDMMIMIKERREKMEEIQRSVELSQKHADREMEEGIRVYNDLMKIIEQSLEQFKQSIEEKHKKTEEEATQLIEKIQTEICSLDQRRAEMEKLWSSEDHLHVLQSFSSVRAVLSLQDWTQVSVKVPLYQGTVEKTVSELEKKLEIKKVLLKLKQQCAVDVTLDPDTAHPRLVLSEDLKQVHDTDQTQNLPDNPERFSVFRYVLGKQKFSSGRFYFEVQVKGKSHWVIGVAKESVNRKTEHDLTSQDGGWYIEKIVVDEDVYISSNYISIRFTLKSSLEKVGVFVDYEEGVVCFHDVDSAQIIYSFTNCCFGENILPFFNPYSNNNGENSTPLKLTPVKLE